MSQKVTILVIVAIVVIVIPLTAFNGDNSIDNKHQRYVLYPRGERSFDFLLDTETGECWRMVLQYGNAGPAWVYMPKEEPTSLAEWYKTHLNQGSQEE